MKTHRCFAAFYDIVSRIEDRQMIGALRARLLAQLEGRVLEIGAGTGLNFGRYPRTARVTAIEPDPFMLRRACRALTATTSHNIRLVQARAEDLPFPGGGFDHVVGTLVLCTVPDPLRALAEIRRTLAADGQLHFIEHVRAEGPLGRAQDLVRPVWKFVAGGCTVNRRTAGLFTAAGFQIERIETATAGFGVPLISGVARPL